MVDIRAGRRRRLYYLNPQHPQLLATERELLEFLSRQEGTRLESKLQRINCFTVTDMREAEHQKMQRLRERGWYPSSDDTVKPLMKVTAGQWVAFDAASPALRSEMAYESRHMQHCVGQFEDKGSLSGGYGEYYARQIEQGAFRLLSLRDENNIPHVTLSLRINNDSMSIDQIKGKQNQHPVKNMPPTFWLYYIICNHVPSATPIVKVWGSSMKRRRNLLAGNLSPMWLILIFTQRSA